MEAAVADGYRGFEHQVAAIVRVLRQRRRRAEDGRSGGRGLRPPAAGGGPARDPVTRMRPTTPSS
jgi:hypothetical protein